MTMTTPRIEEIRKLKTIPLNETHFREGTTYYSEKAILNAITQAHQAGIDEAVEEAKAREKQLRHIHKIELDTISCMSLEQFVVWSDQRKQPKDDTIKALQDNK